MKDPFADTGIFFIGSVIQNVAGSKKDNTSKEDKKIEGVEFNDEPKEHWPAEAVNYLAKETFFKDMEMGNLDLVTILLMDKFRL